MLDNVQALTNEQMQALSVLLPGLANLGVQEKAQTVGAPIGPYLHGPGGLFGVLGLSKPIISTHTQIVESVAGKLPVQLSPDIIPYAGYITGFVRSDEQEKDGVCDNPVDAGNMKTCIQTTAFGRKEFKTRQAEINRIGQRINRGEFFDLQLVNTPLVNEFGAIMMNRFGLNKSKAILAGREMVGRIMEMGVAFQRWFCPTVYTGNPANNSAGGGYMEFPGLDLLISRTKVDAISGDSCPSLYSDVKDYAFVDVQDNNAPYNIVHVLTVMYRFIRHKAITQNMWPVDLRFAMRTGLFDVIADIWPCEYMTYRCQHTAQSTDGNETNVINDMAAVQMRDAMKTGKYLLIDGVKIPVITDDCIARDNNADNANIPVGAFGSDIYLLPFSVRGGSFRSLFWELYDYREGTIPAITDANATSFFWSDGGRWMWSLKAPDNWCLELISKVEPRIRLMTPQFAGRLTNVVWTPLQPLDGPLPTDDYWIDGGIPTGYTPPSPFSEWNLP
jgi:hypothetical protein